MKIEIWSPRWKDRVVLIAKFKVKGYTTDIVFTKSPLDAIGKVFKVSNEIISRCPLDSNGKIDCYAVPLDLIMTDKEKNEKDNPSPNA